MPTPDLDLYLRELDGACYLLVQAQEVDGDAHHQLMELAAEAWREARNAGGFCNHMPIDTRIADFEVEHMTEAGVLPRTYADMCTLYMEQSLGIIRRLLRRLSDEAKRENKQ
jgi:hypothetical protein